MDKLKNKIALVTGSDSGIGQAIAEAYGREGARVVVTYHSDKEGGETTATRIREAGGSAICISMDVSDEKDVEKAFGEISRQLGPVDILVNNAGVNGSNIPVAGMDTEVFDKCIRTNLYGPFFCSRAYLQQAPRGEGIIIFVSSIHEEVNTAGNADYNASKGGIRNFSRSLALELAGKGIRVNNIAPGMILTPMNQEAVDDEALLKEKEQHIPMQRAGKPEEIAALAVYLASAESSYVTGATFTIDGGLSINLGQGA